MYGLINNCNFNLIDLATSVPQGSILGPLPFSLFIVNVVHVTDKLQFIMYADDTIVYFTWKILTQLLGKEIHVVIFNLTYG